MLQSLGRFDLRAVITSRAWSCSENINHCASMARLLLLAGALALSHALPNCEAETEASCLGEDADMSPEGIAACLVKLAEKSADCTTYLGMMAGCADDLKPDAICGEAASNGEAMPCLLQRTKPEALSAACQATLPSDDKSGLAKFWADGKRQLHINEISELNAEDKDTYNSTSPRAPRSAPLSLFP